MKILSFQSHVSHGHVGNSAAQFALQRLGFQVIPIHTVLFSNHPGYGSYSGGAVDAGAIVDGLERLGVFNEIQAVLSGYLGDCANAAALLRVLAAAPQALYVCDPVMGDDGRNYVAAGIPRFMRTQALPAARLITPNLYELEQLSGMRVESLDQARQAARILLKQGPEIVVVTSLGLDGDCACMAVNRSEAWIVRHPHLDFPHPVNGAGDLLAALLTAQILKTAALPEMLENAISALFAVLLKTQETGRRELALIAAQEYLKTPPQRFAAMQDEGLFDARLSGFLPA